VIFCIVLEYLENLSEECMSDENYQNEKGFLEKYLTRETIFVAVIVLISFWLVSDIRYMREDPYKPGSRYFIYLFPSVDSSMNYRLSADFVVDKTCSGGECEGDLQLETVYFNDGDSKYFGCSVQLKTENFCEDQDGKEWMIVLSDWEKAKSIREIKDSKKRVDDLVNSVMKEEN